MDYLSITWILNAWELQSANVVIAQNASNILVVLYAISYIVTNKGCFFAVFLFDEAISNLSIVNDISEPQYYLMISFIYCALYWYIERKNMRLKTLVACGIIILFNSGMALDASVNPEIETVIYSSYTHIIVLIHLYLISTLFRWELIGKFLGACTRAISAISGTSDAFTFFLV